MKQSASFILIAVTLAVFATACSHDDPPSAPRIAVTVMTVAEGEASRSGAYTASFQPDQQVAMAFQVGGYVDSIKQVMGADGRPRDIQGGDHIKAHELLASVKQDTYQAQVSKAAAGVAAAHASFDRAQHDYQRDSELMKLQVIAPSLYDQAAQQYQSSKSEVEQASDALRQAQINLGYCKLSSPIEGEVIDRRIEVGSLVEPSTIAFDVANIDDMKAAFGVSDILVGHLKQGSIQTLTTEALPGAVLIGKITSIAANADPTTRTFQIEVTVPNKDGRLRPGMIAALQMRDGNAAVAEALTLPLNAIVRPPHDARDFAVYVVENQGGRSLASLRKVSLGEIIGNEIAVSHGVAAGDRVIVRGATMVSEGSEVRIIP